MDEKIYNMLIERCKSKGFDVGKLVKTTQECF
jgi:hypothetical protein